jgi:hypothetical protein
LFLSIAVCSLQAQSCAPILCNFLGKREIPLTRFHAEYALDDVRYLIKNYHQLKIRLENEQKLEVFQILILIKFSQIFIHDNARFVQLTTIECFSLCLCL